MNTIDPQDWETGCISDEVRNVFAIPAIRSYIQRNAPRRILDIGCGTGYISRHLIREFEPSSKWIFVDRNSRFLEFAKRMLGKSHAEFLELDILAVDDKFSGLPGDFAFVCYSLLEMHSLELFANGLNKLLLKTAKVVIIYPDVLEDVDDEAVRNKNALFDYRTGLCILNKYDNFTKINQLFYAHRIESIIGRFCQMNFILEDLHIYITTNNKRHFALLFARD